MARLYLLTPISHHNADFPAPHYTRRLLTPGRIRKLLHAMHELRASTRSEVPVPPRRVLDPSTEFIWDETLAKEKRTSDSIYARLLLNRDVLLVGDVRHVHTPARKNHPTMILHPHAVYWTLEAFQADDVFDVWSSAIVREKVLRAAWCLVCPDSELLQAIRDLLQIFPERVAHWLAEGRIAADDGSHKRPIPNLTVEDIWPLLQHDNPKIREQVIVGLQVL